MGGLLADSSDSSSFFLQCSRWQVGYSASLVVCAARWSRHIVLALWPFSSSSCLEASSFPGLTSECGGSGSIGFLLSPMQIKHWVWMNCWHPVGIRLELFFSLFKMLGTLGLMDGFFVSWSSLCSYLQLHSFLQFLNVLFLLFSHSFYCFALLLSFWWVFLSLPTHLLEVQLVIVLLVIAAISKHHNHVRSWSTVNQGPVCAWLLVLDRHWCIVGFCSAFQ